MHICFIHNKILFKYFVIIIISNNIYHYFFSAFLNYNKLVLSYFTFLLFGQVKMIA